MLRAINKTAGYSLIEMMLGIVVATVIVMTVASAYIKHEKRAQVNTLAGEVKTLAGVAKKEYFDTHGSYTGISTEWVNNVGVAPGWLFTPTGGGIPASFATKISQRIIVEAGAGAYSGMLTINLNLVSPDNCVEISKKLFRHTQAIVIDGAPYKDSGVISLAEALDSACGNPGGGNGMAFYF